MSFIGSLEQLDLANILRRVEIFAKTGLLVVQQEHVWMEFYFRQGQLVCTGPVQANVTLIDRLLQAKLLSYQALPQVVAVIDAAESNETRIALALINEGYLSREILRAWAAHETSQALQTISAWPDGEIYFEEGCSTPADRLLVALSISTILDALSASTDSHSMNVGTPRMDESAYASSSNVSARPAPVTSALSHSAPVEQLEATRLMQQVPSFAASIPETQYPASPTPGSFSAAQLIEVVPSFVAQPPAGNVEASGMLNMAQLLDEDALPFGSPSSPAFAEQADAAQSMFGSELNITASTHSSFIPPQPVHNPLPPTRIDTSFMTPDLVLVPVDLSSLREHNPQVQLTPDQWSLFALIDGQVSVQMLCSALMAPATKVCMVAGELIAIGLVMPFTQTTGGFYEMPPQPPAQRSGPLPPVQYAPTSASAWPQQSGTSAPIPMPAVSRPQGGSGTTGPTYAMGGGWMISSQPAAPQSGAAYAPVGGYR